MITYTVVCDRCRWTLDDCESTVSVVSARRCAKAKGWTRSKLTRPGATTGRDYCPECSAQRAFEASQAEAR
jgi:hypothetical protein